MKKIAIIGAGFAGVALTHFLKKSGSIDVTLIDKEHIGAGASGIAAGLMHPYVGEEIKRSHLSEEALACSEGLIREAQRFSSLPLADFSGIDREAADEKQLLRMQELTKTYHDIKQVSDKTFHISSGVTVQTLDYLKALWLAAEDLGARFEKREVNYLSQLNGYDAIVIAAGAGVFSFPELSSFRLDFTKGQTLCCAWEGEELPRSLISRGYIAKKREIGHVSIGSTYERGVVNTEPDVDFAKQKIFEKLSNLLQGKCLKIIEGKAAIRVSSKGHYFPLAGCVKENIYIFTGLGSRGLLYHALFAKMLSASILTGDESHLPKITQQLLSKNRELSYNKLL